MRQISIATHFGRTEEESAPAKQPLPCYDIFCGGGGWSVGAEKAGGAVVFACDSSEEALEVHRCNHPRATHLRAELPCALPWPRDGRLFHAHFSPPCTRLSQLQGGRIDKSEHTAAVDLVEWSLLEALSCGATSWSLEQVNVESVRVVLERVRLANLKRVAWAIFPFHELGVPQRRTRILAGPPSLIRRMLQLRLTQPRRSIREALEGRVQAPHLRNSTSWFKRRERQKRKPGESRYVYAKCAWSTNLVPVDGPAPTLLASNNNLTWIQLEGGQVHRSVITAEEAKRLQTFPASFILPDNRALAQRIIGNAVPPLVAELMLRCARATQ